jgi:hypothetical protein
MRWIRPVTLVSDVIPEVVLATRRFLASSSGTGPPAVRWPSSLLAMAAPF